MSSGRVGTVLVIEDDEALRAAVCMVLRQRGFRVMEAPDGRAGMELFQAHLADFGAVLLDFNLPGLSGPEALVEMRRMRPDVKVVMTTTERRENALFAFGGLEPWGFLRKPYEFDALVDLLREACQSSGQGQLD